MAWPYRYVAGLPPRNTKRGRYLFNNANGELEWKLPASEAPVTVDVVEQLGLDHEGIEDCAVLLNAATFNDGSTLFFPEGIYRFSTQWEIAALNLKLVGVGSSGSSPSTIFRCSESIHMIRLIGTSAAARISGIRFEGVESDDGQDNAKPASFLLFRKDDDAEEFTNGRIEHCAFLYGDSAVNIYFANQFEVDHCLFDSSMIYSLVLYSPKRTRVTHCHFVNNGHGYQGELNEDAIKFSAGPVGEEATTNVTDTVLVAHNWFENSAQDGIDVHVEHCRNLVIAHNHFRGNARVIDIKPVDDDSSTFTVEDNGYLGWTGFIFESNTCYNSGDVVLNNFITGAPGSHALRALSINNNTVYSGSIVATGDTSCAAHNCSISGNLVVGGRLDVRNLIDSVVANNCIHAESGTAIQGLRCERVSFANNSCAGGNFELSTENDNCLVANNSVNGNELRVTAATTCLVAGNYLTGTLRVGSGATGCSIFGNVAATTGQQGVLMDNGAGCVYAGNYFSGDRYGTIAITTHESTLYFNNYSSHISSSSGFGGIRFNAAASAGLFFNNVFHSPSRQAIYVANTSAPAIVTGNVAIKPDTELTYNQSTAGGIAQTTLIAKASDAIPASYDASYGDLVHTLGNDNVLAWACTAASDEGNPTWKAVLKSSAP